MKDGEVAWPSRQGTQLAFWESWILFLTLPWTVGKFFYPLNHLFFGCKRFEAENRQCSIQHSGVLTTAEALFNALFIRES